MDDGLRLAIHDLLTTCREMEKRLFILGKEFHSARAAGFDTSAPLRAKCELDVQFDIKQQVVLKLMDAEK